MTDELGDRMKMYEGVEAGRRLMPLLPIVARLDGRSFHNFTKGMNRPFDEIFTSCMVDTCKELVSHTGALVGYTQSDEITLVWHSQSTKSQIWFDGRVQKMTSQLAAQATLVFYRLVFERMPEYANRLPSFDARVWNVPTREEAVNAILWREWDATKNSITMAASSYYSHKELHRKNSKEKLDMLQLAGVNWNNYPPSFKRGTYVRRKTMEVAFSTEELDKLPKNHDARKNPDLKVIRSVVGVEDMPILEKVTNRVEVMFGGAVPVTEEKK